MVVKIYRLGDAYIYTLIYHYSQYGYYPCLPVNSEEHRIFYMCDNSGCSGSSWCSGQSWYYSPGI